jgi:hypothetical protein
MPARIDRRPAQLDWLESLAVERLKSIKSTIHLLYNAQSINNTINYGYNNFPIVCSLSSDQRIGRRNFVQARQQMQMIAGLKRIVLKQCQRKRIKRSAITIRSFVVSIIIGSINARQDCGNDKKQTKRQ